MRTAAAKPGESWAAQITPYLALRLCAGVGDRTFRHLLERFGSPSTVFAQPKKVLLSEGIDEKTATILSGGLDEGAARAQLDRAHRVGATLLWLGSPLYPKRLLDLADPPAILWVQGKLPPPEQPALAVVGTRVPDAYGRSQGHRIAQACSQAGCAIVSGGARGIDAVAHQGALDAGGATVAVLGGGLDVPYPAEHRGLFVDIVRGGGAVLSEFPLGSRPNRGTFVRRNRLIAALGGAVLVVQAGRRSGTLSTAAQARAIGRPIFAVPGPVDREQSEGVHQLLREGALVCEGPGDVLETLGVGDTVLQPTHPNLSLGADARRVLELIASQPLPFDDIVASSGLRYERAAEVLLDLEINGAVTLDQGSYRKKD